MKRIAEGQYRGRVIVDGKLRLPKELLERLGISPGDWVVIEEKADGEFTVRPEKKTGGKK